MNHLWCVVGCMFVAVQMMFVTVVGTILAFFIVYLAGNSLVGLQVNQTIIAGVSVPTRSNSFSTSLRVNTDALPYAF